MGGFAASIAVSWNVEREVVGTFESSRLRRLLYICAMMGEMVRSGVRGHVMAVGISFRGVSRWVQVGGLSSPQPGSIFLLFRTATFGVDRRCEADFTSQERNLIVNHSSIEVVETVMLYIALLSRAVSWHNGAGVINSLDRNGFLPVL